MTLQTLVLHAEICHYDFVFWFKGAELKGDVLIIDNPIAARFITNGWLPQMRELLPTLTIFVKPQVEKPKAYTGILNAKGRKWETARAQQVRLPDDE